MKASCSSNPSKKGPACLNKRSLACLNKASLMHLLSQRTSRPWKGPNNKNLKTETIWIYAKCTSIFTTLHNLSMRHPTLELAPFYLLTPESWFPIPVGILFLPLLQHIQELETFGNQSNFGDRLAPHLETPAEIQTPSQWDLSMHVFRCASISCFQVVSESVSYPFF